MQIETIETPSLGNRGYLVHDGTVGVAIDVQRDYDRWIESARQEGIEILYVLETHMHNDYITGGFQLAKKLNATYVVPADSGITFVAHKMKDSETIEVGSLKITGLHTPGHTEHHMSYTASDGTQEAVFTGGGILYGTVGRTDLVTKEKTTALTNLQYESAQRLGRELPDTAHIYPTHGFGSFCSSSDGSGATESTLKDEKLGNIAFTLDREQFIKQIIAGLGPYPRYYAHMGSGNQAGPPEMSQLHIHDYSAEEIESTLKQDGTWIIDTRSRIAYATSHPKGALGIELGNSFATYAGWVLPWSDKILLVGDSAESLKTAHIELARIGMDSFITGSTHDTKQYLQAGQLASYENITFAELARQTSSETFVLDVRLSDDWNELHVQNSVNIPLHELLERTNELPHNQPIWVHCKSGYRASIAASIIDYSGRTPVLINDDFENAVKLKLVD